MVQCVTEPTHQDGHILDLVVIRQDDDLVKSVIVHSAISDHYAVHVDLNTTKPRLSKKTITYRKYKDINHDVLQQDLLKSDLLLNPDDDLDNLVSQYDSSPNMPPEDFNFCYASSGPMDDWGNTRYKTDM